MAPRLHAVVYFCETSVCPAVDTATTVRFGDTGISGSRSCFGRDGSVYDGEP